MMTKTKRVLPTTFEGETFNDGDRISFDHKGFTVVAKLVADYDADVSHIGAFSNEPNEGAIDHHATGKWLDRSHRGDRYFNPANYDYKHYIEAKKSKSVARRLANQHARLDYDRLVGYYTGEWSMLGVVLTISRDGVSLGEASLWSIESDSGSYFNEVVRDLLHDAQAEAQQKLKLLADFAKAVE
jgi:hypothetical protein